MALELNGIKNGLVSGYHTAANQVGKWAGRAISFLKSGGQKALPYLQDKRIAVVSLIAVNLLLVECASLCRRLLLKYVPGNSDLKDQYRFTAIAALMPAVIGGGVAAFAKYTKLPLSPLVIAGITIGTVTARVLLD
jgi:hypothetical protein